MVAHFVKLTEPKISWEFSCERQMNLRIQGTAFKRISPRKKEVIRIRKITAAYFLPEDNSPHSVLLEGNFTLYVFSAYFTPAIFLLIAFIHRIPVTLLAPTVKLLIVCTETILITW